MTEPPRPPGEGDHGAMPPDPTSPPPPPGPYSVPGDTSAAGYHPPPAAPQYGGPTAPPPTSGGGAYPPPPGGYPPPGGTYYGAGGVPVGYATNDDKTWALLAHFGGIVLGFLAPLIAMLAKGSQSPTVRAHSVEALNFQITWAIATLVASVLAVCTFGVLFFLPLLTWVVIIVFAIIGGVKANEGVLYRYPMTVRLVK